MSLQQASLWPRRHRHIQRNGASNASAHCRHLQRQTRSKQSTLCSLHIMCPWLRLTLHMHMRSSSRQCSLLRHGRPLLDQGQPTLRSHLHNHHPATRTWRDRRRVRGMRSTQTCACTRHRTQGHGSRCSSTRGRRQRTHSMWSPCTLRRDRGHRRSRRRHRARHSGRQHQSTHRHSRHQAQRQARC